MLFLLIGSLIGCGSEQTSSVGDDGTQEPTATVDPTLEGLAFDVGTLSPSFSPDQTNYTLVVPAWASNVRAYPKQSDINITVTVNDKLTQMDQVSDSFDLGANATLDINVIATRGKRDKIYQIHVTRATTAPTYLKALEAAADVRFGYDVDMDAHTILVGAPLQTGPINIFGIGENAGAAYTFTRTSSGVQGPFRLATQGLLRDDHFGYSVAVDGDTLAVGAPGANSTDSTETARPDSGTVFVFVRSGDAWQLQQRLKAPAVCDGDQFGYAIDLKGDTLVVGAPYEDSRLNDQGQPWLEDDAAPDSGAAYVFVRTGTTWSPTAIIKASNNASGAEFGCDVAIDKGMLAVGARSEDRLATGVNSSDANQIPPTSDVRAGAAYVFTQQNAAWTQQAYIKASNTRADAYFGRAVAIRGDTLVVASSREAGGGYGVDADPTRFGAEHSGSVYVFERHDGVWTQHAYLKASNANANDFFGISVSLDQNTLVVGALAEDSDARGLNGSETSNAAPNSGAAYIFARVGNRWAQKAYLKQPNTMTTVPAFFGFSVATYNNAVLVGAPQEQSAATGVNGNQNDASLVYSGASYLY